MAADCKAFELSMLRTTLELMAADNLHDIVAMAQNQVQTFFYTDYVNFCFHDELSAQLQGLEKNILDSSSKHAGKIRDWMQKRQPVKCGAVAVILASKLRVNLMVLGGSAPCHCYSDQMVRPCGSAMSQMS